MCARQRQSKDEKEDGVEGQRDVKVGSTTGRWRDSRWPGMAGEEGGGGAPAEPLNVHLM